MIHCAHSPFTRDTAVTRDHLIGLAGALCAAVAIWCSLGTIGLGGGASGRVALLPPWWLLPLLVGAVFAGLRVLRLTPRELSPLFGSLVALLPWLPGSIPPAALIWTGPFLVILWSAVIVGLITLRFANVRIGWFTDPRRAAITTTTLALAIYVASAIWLSPLLPDGDEPHYLILAQSLIKDGDVKIENNHRQGDYLAYSLTAAAPDYLRRGTNGEIYSIHAPGLPVLIAPAMRLFGYPGVVGFLAVIAALSSALVWSIGFRVTGSSAAAWFGWASCALTAPFFFQATEVFPDGIAATFLLIGTLPLYTDSRNQLSASPLLIVSGAALAMLPWLQTRLAVLAIAAAVCVILRLRSARQLAAFIAVPAVAAAAWFGFFVVVYGTPNPTAPYGPYTQTSVGNLVRGIPGLLFDQQFGLIPNAPVYGFILTGTLTALLTLRRWSWETLALTLPYMMAVGTYQMWWGGTSVPARLLAPVTLILGIAGARVWRQIQAPTKTLGLFAVVVSVVITATLLGPDHGRLLLNFRDGISLWLEYANGVVDLPKGLPSVFRDARAMLWAKAAIWAAAAAILWVVCRAVASKMSPRGDNSLVMSGGAIWCAAIGVMGAFTLTWQVDGMPVLTPATAEIDLLRHFSSLRSRAFDFSQRQFRPSQALLSGLQIATDERRPIAPPTLFAVRDLPAGEYELKTGGRESAGGILTVHAGLTDLPFLTVPAASGDRPSADRRFRLASRIRSLTITGDPAAQRSVGDVGLVALSPFANDSPEARRAAGYESADVFFLDEHAYPERTGFWVAGARTAEFTIASRNPHVDLFVRNAPVDNHLTITADGELRELKLVAGEEQLIPLPSPRGTSPLRLRITTHSGFRPAMVEPASTDQRYLGCWIELR